MAIDTREKRQSVAWLLPISAPSVTPNASKDQEWRQQSGWGYSGILADTPAISVSRMPVYVTAYFEASAGDARVEPALVHSERF